MQTVRIGLAWHSPNSGNLGVGALTVANLALARDAAAAAGVTPRFVILGFVDPGQPLYVEAADVEVIALDSHAMLPGGAFWRAIARLDCVLDIGAGDSFTDIYGSKRFAFLFGSKAIAIAKDVPLSFSPQTIGPFSRILPSHLAAWAMNRATTVWTRDPLSSRVAREMAPAAAVREAVDVAFRLPFERPERLPGPPRVGLNVSGLLFNGGYSGANEFGMDIDYPAFTRALIAALQQRGIHVELIAHVNSDVLPKDDDRRVADALAAEFPGTVRVPDFASPSAAKSHIAGLDFLVAGRMHACIAAYSSGIPVVPVAYSRKFTGLFEGVLGYGHVLPVKGVSTGTAVEFTLGRFAKREALEAEIAQGMSKVDGLLAAYRDDLTALFAQVIR